MVLAQDGLTKYIFIVHVCVLWMSLSPSFEQAYGAFFFDKVENVLQKRLRMPLKEVLMECRLSPLPTNVKIVV